MPSPLASAGSAGDPLADAPEDAEAFLRWTLGALARLPPPGPPARAPRLATPRAPVVRLVDRMEGAVVDAAAERARTPPAPLVTLGPFRSDRNEAQARTRRAFHRKLGRFLAMQIGGFQLEREDVGRIELDVRAPFGRYLALKWSPFGYARLPLPHNDRPCTLRLRTDGLADWSGPLAAITLESDGAEAGVIEVQALRFYGHDDAFPDAAGALPVTLDRTRRPAVYVRPGTTVRFPDVEVPPDGRLAVGLGRAVAADAPLTAQLHLEAGSRRETLLDRAVTAARWEDVSLSLAARAGERVTLTLAVAGPDDEAVALWADPTIYQPVPEPPLVVLYLIDTLAARHVDLYGHTRPTMPTLGALAAGGVWFAHAYCNSPVTVASIPDLMLSMPTERHGVHSYSFRAPATLVTLAEALRAAGFATLSAVTNVNAGPRQAMDRGFDTLIDRIAFARDTTVDRTVPLAEVTDWLRRHADRPRFAYVHTAEPHAPYSPPPGFAGRFGGEPALPLHPSGFPKVTDAAALERARARYDEEVLYADARLGAFLDTLTDLGVRDRAHLIVTADHGEELQEHGHWGHGPTLYEEVLRVPLVVAGPGVRARGRVDRPAQLYDVMPTVLDLVGVPHPYPLEGESLLPWLAGATPPARDDARVVVVSHHRHWGHGVIEYAVIEDARWKLVVRFPGTTRTDASRFELFDLAADPGERTSLVAERPEVVRRLVAHLLDYQRRQRPYGEAGSVQVEYDPTQLEQLRALGYVE